MKPDVVSTWSVEEVVEERDGYWTIRDVATGIFGSGADQLSATEDFERALREHLEILRCQEVLSPDLSAQLEYLRRRLA